MGEDAAGRPASVQTVRLPLDEIDDREFWAGEWENGPQFGTPLYYGPHLQRFPAKSAEVIAAIADAGPGGVAFHCAGLIVDLVESTDLYGALQTGGLGEGDVEALRVRLLD